MALIPGVQRRRSTSTRATTWAGGFISLISLITADNIASIRLHERHGFTNVGTLRKVGRKFDQWVDVTFMQLIAPETKISS